MDPAMSIGATAEAQRLRAIAGSLGRMRSDVTPVQGYFPLDRATVAAIPHVGDGGTPDARRVRSARQGGQTRHERP